VESYATVIVRRARDADVRDAALVAAAVAEEDFLGLQPPVDLEARAERYREFEARGRGGGRALLKAVQDHARACKAHKISLEVWTDNARAIALYAAAGFEVEGVRRDHYRRRDGRLRSTLIMAWRTDTGREDPPAAGN
jgi:putative acetyltransferase